MNYSVQVIELRKGTVTGIDRAGAEWMLAICVQKARKQLKEKQHLLC